MSKGFIITGVFAACLFSGLSRCGTNAANAANPLQEYYQKGEKAYRKGQYKQAITYYEQVVEMKPDFAPVYNALGLAYMGADAGVSDILWFFEEAIAIDPAYGSAYENMCRIYYQTGAYDDAQEACLKALSIDPSLTKAQLSLAWIYLTVKSQPGPAIYYFDEVLKSVKHPRIYFGLGIAHSIKGHRAEVLDVVTTLRGLEESEMAGQLENTLRPGGSPEAFTQKIPSPTRQPGQLISAGLPPSLQEVDAGSPHATAGGMRVRLRGKLTNIPTSQENASAIERIRAMRRGR